MKSSFPVEVFSDRRRRFQAGMKPGSVALFFSAEPALKTHDVHHRFRQDTDFYYLTGLEEEQCALVMSTDQVILFLRDSNPEEEQWAGRRLGVEAAADALGVDEARDIDEFDEDIGPLLKNKKNLYYFYGRNVDHDLSVMSSLQDVLSKARRGDFGPTRVIHPSILLHEMRLIKSAHEIEQFKENAIITERAHLAAIQAVRPGMHEYELEALLHYEFRKGGGLEGYTSIVAAGANACILHYIENDAEIVDGDLIMIDAGVEKNFINVDVSRTFPANGTFSPAQREAYQLVLDVQKQAISETVAGNTLTGVHENAVHGLVRGLIDLGFFNGASFEKVMEDGLYKKYYMHRTGHWLGGDVHDVGVYYIEGEPRPFEDGMICTVEPGLYFPDDEETPERFRGIGIRIEDDVLVNGDSPVVLTASIPKEIEDIEISRPAAKPPDPINYFK